MWLIFAILTVSEVRPGGQCAAQSPGVLAPRARVQCPAGQGAQPRLA